MTCRWRAKRVSVHFLARQSNSGVVLGDLFFEEVVGMAKNPLSVLNLPLYLDAHLDTLGTETKY